MIAPKMLPALCLCLAIGGAPGFAEETAAASSAPATTSDATVLRTGEPIETGFVLRNGQLVALPYVLSQAGQQVYINGEPLPELVPFASGSERAQSRRAAVSRLSRLEQLLCEESLLIQTPGGLLVAVDSDAAHQILEILGSDLSRSEKLHGLMRVEGHPFDTAEWAPIVDHFQPTQAMFDRLMPCDDESATAGEAMPLEGVSLFDPRSKRFTYGLTIIGMLLAVVSFGTILSFRPAPAAPWRLENRSADAVTLVTRCVVLIGLMSAFDLVATLVMHFTGGFIEVNPIADSMISMPVVLVLFKVFMTGLAAAILLRLRFYHGTQVASWWICLLLTLLTCRWVAVESLLLA